MTIEINVQQPDARQGGRPRPKRGKFPWLALIIVVLLVAVGGLAGFKWLGGGNVNQASVPPTAEPDSKNPSTSGEPVSRDKNSQSFSDDLNASSQSDETSQPSVDHAEIPFEATPGPVSPKDDSPAEAQRAIKRKELQQALDQIASSNNPKEEMTAEGKSPETGKDSDGRGLSGGSFVSESNVPASLKEPGADAPSEGDILVQLYEDGKLFKPYQYETLRGLRAERFEREHSEAIESAFGNSDPSARKWLEDHPTIKEELYVAIDPEHDDVTEAIRLFNQMRETHPEQIETHSPLAIAIAVVWDDGRGVYQYGHHRRRAKATDPQDSGLEEAKSMDGLGNFEYFLRAENVMQGRGQFLPWEFLTHVVNHGSPFGDRKWAVSKYLPARVGFGKCYGDVPYDHGMLQSKSEVCRMDGKPYTFANLDQYGGVCAHQADFAARVGKSLGVPAAYVSGQGRFGGAGHAWVMWVELQSVSSRGIQFRLESHGRYRGDHYYIGNLKDAQTGERITDRYLEQQLSAIGNQPLAFRQAKWLMEWFPLLRDTLELDVLDQLRYLENVVAISPLSRPAWTALAEMSKTGVIESRHEKLMNANLRGLFNNFANYPDFTWQIFNDLIAFQQRDDKRNELFNQLITLYESAGRPDLASEARLVFADELVRQEKVGIAITGLSQGILRFPQEGRYVPKMLDRMEQLVEVNQVDRTALLAFYRQFLPVIQQKRGDSPSQYCISMYERGIERFRESGDQTTANQLQAKLIKLKAS
ncbi:MAG: hypothetical protein AAFV88_08690 [Planctomycetota bacterium]